jgi:hypothetical protein
MKNLRGLAMENNDGKSPGGRSYITERIFAGD